MTTGGNGRGIEPNAAVAHEDSDLLVTDLRVDVDLLDACELRSVRHRLPCGEDKRGVGRRVTGARDLDAYAVEFLDVGRCRGESSEHRGRVVADGLICVQPAA